MEVTYKADFHKICQVTSENCLDRELILEDPDADIFVQPGIRIGTAYRFLQDINEYIEMKPNALFNPVLFLSLIKIKASQPLEPSHIPYSGSSLHPPCLHPRHPQHLRPILPPRYQNYPSDEKASHPRHL